MGRAGQRENGVTRRGRGDADMQGPHVSGRASTSGLRWELAGHAEEAGPRRWCGPRAEERAGRSGEEFWGRVWFSFFWFFFLLFFFKLHSNYLNALNQIKLCTSMNAQTC